MDPTVHTVLRHPSAPLTLDEWRRATSSIESFRITDEIKQQNPFTSEFLFMKSPGSGFWNCKKVDGPTWTNDDAIWFRFAGGQVMFIQFSNVDDPELVKLANTLGAVVEHYSIDDE